VAIGQLIQYRLILVVAVSIPTAALLWLRSASSPIMTPSTMLVVGALWLATAVIALNTLKNGSAPGRVGRTDTGRTTAAAASPTSDAGVTRPSRLRRAADILQVPFELLALAWSIPVVILLIMVPIGLALAVVLWLGRLVFSSM
jgi:hypothetical protein